MYKKQNQYDYTLETFKSIQNKLDKDFKNKLHEKKVFLAIDGFIDSIYSMIKTRSSSDIYQRFNTINELADRLYEIKGSSGNIELKLKKSTIGGFVPNNAKALSSLGIKIFLLGALGYPQINNIFKPLISKKNVEICSIANPGKTIGLEFNDGKIMLSDLEDLSEINWNLLEQRIDMEKLIKNLENSNTIGFGYWGLTQELSDIWKHLVEEIFPSINNLNKKLFSIDLGDFKKHNKSSILEMIEVLKNIEEQIPVLLSLNDQEAIDLSKSLNDNNTIPLNKRNKEDFIFRGNTINKKINLSYIVIHSPHFATISLKNDKNHFWITEGFTSKPSFTISGGDHFLSGVIAGFLGDLKPPEAILMGNALTATFVRTGTSPRFGQLKEFIKKYMEYIYKDNPFF